MTEEFTRLQDRKGRASLKWQRYEQQDVIPMWVADMDLPAPQAVREALGKAVELGALGYGEVPPRLVDAFLNWCQQQYGWQPMPEELVWLPGVVPGFNLAVEALTKADDQILVQTPVYPPIRVLGKLRQRAQQDLPLKPPSEGESQWSLQVEQLAAALEDKTSALVLCNPQNPTGRCYSPEELKELARLAAAKKLLVISDEIWADLLLKPEARHLPYPAVSNEAAQHSITLMAPSKTFNVAGLSCAVAIIPNPELREPFRKAMRGLMPDMNYMGILAAEAAWTKGAAWLQDLKQHLNNNLDLLEAWLQNPDHPRRQLIGYCRPEATFVAWLDVSRLELENPWQAFLDAGVALSPGEAFGDDHYLRLNFGCPAAQLEAALERMHQVIG
ncbi:MalY/PatB family protein [Marinospirillum celere]|nr:PatB family C-S lyase [Marinospirillum celere]